MPSVGKPLHVFLRADAGGGPRARAFRPDGTTSHDFFVFESTFTCGVRVATADVNGDGVGDIFAAAGDGGEPLIVIFDGSTGAALWNFLAIPDTLRVGVFVASADVNGDGFADYAVSASAGGGPRVVIFDGKTGDRIGNDFFAFDSSDRNGVMIALGDVATG